MLKFSPAKTLILYSGSYILHTTNGVQHLLHVAQGEVQLTCTLEYKCNRYVTIINLKAALTFITVLACPLTCQNNGKLNAGTCTCDCAWLQ